MFKVVAFGISTVFATCAVPPPRTNCDGTTLHLIPWDSDVRSLLASLDSVAVTTELSVGDAATQFPMNLPMFSRARSRRIETTPGVSAVEAWFNSTAVREQEAIIGVSS